LSGLFTADGSVQGSTEKGVQVRLSSSDLDLLKQVQQLLLNFGIYSKIYENRRDKGKREMPDGKGGTKEYEVRAQHDLAIAKGEIIKFREEIGFLVDEKSQKLDEKLSQYERGPYSQKRLATVEKVEKDGHEDVYDLTEPDTSSFVANGLVVHNCGEQPLENYEACNLGHVNLSLMVENRKDGAALQFDDWKSENEIEYESEEELDAAMEKYLKEALKMDELERVAKVGTRFLDNVVTMSDFPLQEIEDKVSSMRKVGLGLMGFHQMLIQLGIRYGSEESIAAAREIQRLLTRFSVEESHELAEARGAFDEWEDSKWADPTEYPEWFRKYSGGYEAEEFEDGLKLRNHNTTTIAPTGCVKEDTLISTEDGLEEISDFQGTRINQKWSETSTTEVKSDEGTVEATRHFDNGRVDVQKIKTEEGFEVTATPDHKFRVVDSNGNYAWRETQKIKDGDRVVLQRGTMETEIVETELDTSERENFYRNTDEKLELPSRISENLAEFLGYFMGDGYVHEEVGVKLVVDARQEELEKHLKELGEKVFGVRPTVEDRDSRKMLAFGGRHLPRYFEDNGWKKESGNEGEGAASAFIPEQVLSSGQRPAKAFLRGLFEADGTCPRKVELSTVSEHLARQVQNLLLSLGVVFKREALEAEKLGENHKGDRDRHIVRGLNRREDKLFLEDIGFITKTPDQEIELTSRSYRKDDFPSVMVEELTGAEGFDELDQSLKHKVRQSRYQSLTKKTAEEVVAEVETEDLKVKKFIENDFFLGTVESKQEGVARTHDLEIPENHTYVANGFITHNTTSMIGNTSGGCEPIYQVAYFKNVAKDIQGEDMLVEFDDYFLKALRANDVDVERVKAEVEDLMENNEWEGVQSLDDEVLPPRVKQIFVTSGDITAEEHVDIQAAFQEYNHSGISKTINFDHSATKEDVREAYMRAYEKGVKGMTVYRDGTRDVQVMQQNKENTLTDMDKVDALAEIADDFDSKEELLHSDELKEALGLEEARIEVGKSEDGLEQEVTQEGIEASSAGPGDHTSMGGSSGVKERPKVAKGTTQEIETAYGDLFVTINDSEDNGPFEVFANLGKSGGYTQSFTQALGRMTSLALRSGATGKDVIKQLDDIRSPQIAWDEGTQIHSVPDAIAEAMKRHISQHDGSQQTFDRFDSGNDTRNVGKTEKEEQADAAAIVADGDNPECPECGGMLELSEGCQKCPSCGWSKC
ncbi:MAG: LAGLIDADG family homing endonuclease, partial [Candidatus Nanohaloarchaea archaeon]